MTEPKQYTTAIIAAVPSAEDPVHEVVAEDAHVTLQFLGEAANLSPEQVEDIQNTLANLASVVYPFEVPIAGTAELGPDKAQVLLVQSELLTKIREILGISEAVSTATASADQFPNWIPHLTLAYEGEMPDVAAYKTVEIGSLELWLAEEHHTFPLNQKTPVTAAGLKTFDDGLHPRGADGRFIEKFGVIKFLSSLGWQYGKVDGIYADDASGAVKLTITPSDLSGNPKGESIVLSPNQVYRAPKKKAHLLTSMTGVKKIGGQGGSNPGGLYEMEIPSASPNPAVEKFYVKKPKSVSHGNNEALANALYEEAGVPVPEVDLANDGQLYSKIVNGQQDMQSQLKNDAWTDQVRRNFAVDAWLGNRDVFGMTYDNILTDENGVPWRIDNGGALLYRAMGEKKTDFGGQVTELDAFRQGKKAAIFGPGMTKAQELDGAERVLAISPGQIEEMVASHALPKSLADTLKARRLYIANYYGLALPESKKPAEAEQPTSAPLVDAPDIAGNKGKPRIWFKTSLAQMGMFGEAGDMVEFPDGTQKDIGVDDKGTPLSAIAAQAQLIKWQHQHGAASEVFLKKQAVPGIPRPEHGSTLAGADLAQQRWHRGDKVIDSDGIPWTVLAWNKDSGAVLMQWQTSMKSPVLFDTKGADANLTFTVERWDPPKVEALDDSIAAVPTPVMTEQQALDEVNALPEMPNTSTIDDLIAKHAAEPSKVETLGGDSTFVPQSELVKDLIANDVTGEYEDLTAPQPGKTGQAAVAETQIKADLDQPLPDGNGQPAPKKTSAPGGAKTMVVGDGTEAATGDAVTSKKDGKTYTFVKPKGQYAVVTDPNGEDPNKQLLKLASTMTQPGKLPAGDLDVELPKTSTGEIPALGMMALAKDGWAGEITMISPDGKFVFITDANGKRKRKSTGTVSITSAPAPAGNPPDAPKTSPGPIKPYGAFPKGSWTGEEKASHLAPDPGALFPSELVHVGYADGTSGLEPYTGQPWEALQQNTQGAVVTYGNLKDYLGPVAAEQVASAAGSHDTTYQVIWKGTIAYTDGHTGPSGGLILNYTEGVDPGIDGWELPPTGQTIQIVGSEPSTAVPLTTPTDTNLQEWSADDTAFNAPGPIWGEEAKTLQDWKGQISEGQEISLDGEHWLEVKKVYAGGSLDVEDSGGTTTMINAWGNATFVLKAPPLKDPADDPAWGVHIADTPEADLPPALGGPGKKKIGDFVQGDVVTDGEGNVSIIDSVTDPDDGTQQVYVKAMGEDWPSPADPNYEFVHHGNITENPVSVPIGVVAPHLYPGATLQLSDDALPMQVISYPEKQDNGSYKVALMVDGDPDNLTIMHTGADVSETLNVQANLGGFTSIADAGVDPAKLNALWDAEKTVDTAPKTDHKIQMVEQGISFGTAGYPIHFNESSGTYFRPGQKGGVEEWDQQSGTWSAVFGGLLDKEKVWDGVPFEGTIGDLVPEGYPANFMLDSKGDLATYKPKPGETIQVAKVQMASGEHTVLITYPMGLEGDAYPLWSTGAGNGPQSSGTTLPKGWQNTGDFSDIQTIWDPYAEPSNEKTVTHQQGAQPPPDLGAKLQTYGYTPSPGETIWVSQIEHDSGTALAVLSKQPDGNFKKIGYGGTLGDHVWTPEKLKDYSPPAEGTADVQHYTWTYVPADSDAPGVVAGLPEGFQPFVPGDGQAVLKVTLPNGKTNVYLQKQPGAGWYEMSTDGTVNENSDAVKSDHAVQMKLAGKGSQQVKYDLLHPLPEGQKAPGKEIPTFDNGHGAWTPEPHQKVVSMVGYEGDPDPWYWIQDEPGGFWEASPTSPSAPTSISPESMQDYLSGPHGGKYALVYDGQAGQHSPPSFGHHTPKPGTAVYEDSNIGGPGSGDYWAQLDPNGGFYFVKDDGTYSTSGVTQADMDADPAMTKVWPKAGQSAVDTPEKALPSFGGYTPEEGEKVIQEENGSYWVFTPGDSTYHPLNDDGTLDMGYGLSETQWAASSTSDLPQVWPVDEPGAAPEAAQPQTFKGYTPKPGETVIQTAGNVEGIAYVQQEPGGNWFQIKDDGSLGNTGGGGVFDSQMQTYISGGSMDVVWPTGGAAQAAAPGIFKGFQTDPGDIVFEITNASGIATNPTYIKIEQTGEWHLLTEGGGLSDDVYSQGTVDWAIGEYEINELQGTVKGSGIDSAPADIPAVNQAYAGVSTATILADGSYHFGTFVPSADQQKKIKGLGTLEKGHSIYALENQDGMAASAIVVRNSQGQWSGTTPTGTIFALMSDGNWSPSLTLANDDEAAEAYFQSVGYTIHKMQFGAPAAAPAAAPSGPKIPTLTKWEGKTPAPDNFHWYPDGNAAKAAGVGDGSKVYIHGNAGAGLILGIEGDFDNPASFTANFMPVNNGEVGDAPLGSSPGWNLTTQSGGFWATGGTGTPTGTATPAPSTPAAAPSAPTPAAPSAPATPAYPGAQKPAQEDINAWGGSLTKDGHIPTSGMFVTGKGPMSGKIISVSKDKTKAVVLTSDGKKTTRLIEALKVDISANYSAYAAPVTAKDIPQGMPLAVDTVAEALQKTVQDGKFRAVLTAHAGVSHGEMVVTKATGPSGKAYNRVHLTLTPAQREQLVAMLAGTGEKGDWATSSKMSDAVAVGDKLPMRLSSQANPDGTPRWKVDPSQVPPTHEVTGVTDDPATPGIKIVTMKHTTTGEEITSRFHPGKNLTVYVWDANKPKKVAPGAFSVGAAAKAQGWTLANDGGISAAKGGADAAVLHHEPGAAVSKGAFQDAKHAWQTLRNVSADGVVIELVDPKGPDKNSTTGATVISVPEGVDETALGAALSKLGIDYTPMTQDSAKTHMRGMLRTLLSLDINDVDSDKGWTDEKLFSEAGKVMGLSDLGWQDVLVGVDESTGKTSFFWSDRARNALKAKSSYNLVYRAASDASARAIVSTVKYGSANSVLKRTTGMVDGSAHQGGGASWSSDYSNHAGHGSYASASTVGKLPSSNSMASYKTAGMMIYHRPEAVLGRIMDIRLASHDAFGMGQGSGANHLKAATTMSSVRDYFLGGGLPTEAVGFIAVTSADERTKAIAQLKADGFSHINGRPIEDIIITKQKAATLKPDDLPPVTIPSNARPILDLPQAYDAPAAPTTAVTADAGEAA